MKRTLVTGLLLLGIVLGLNAMAIVRPLQEDLTDAQRDDRANSVRIYSCALGLEPARFVVARTPIAVIIDGEFRSGPVGEHGLRVIAIDRGRVGELHSFNLAHSIDAIDSFSEFCEQTRPGTVLAMGVHQVASPSLDDTSGRRDRLDAVFRQLGARLPPTVNPRASWAYLCVRGEDGWMPIAEAQSPTRGVSLARMLSTDPADLEAIPPTLMVDNLREISLISWFDRASYVTKDFTHVRRPDNSISGGPLDSIFAHPPYGDKAKLLEHKDNRLAWDDFQIPEQATFITQLGISSWARAESDGVVYHLFIDGEEVASRTLGTSPSEPETWVSWKVDLSRFGGRTVRLELRVSANGHVYSDQSVWGDPTIVFPDLSQHLLRFDGEVVPLRQSPSE